jgi:hypothetical protein
MSSEMYVLFGGPLPSIEALHGAMNELGFPTAIKAMVESLERQNGFMPMTVRGEDSGVEFDVWDDRDTIQEIAGDEHDPRFERSANFRWGGDFNELLCAVCTAAALAKLLNGMVRDEYEDHLLTPDEVIAQARQNLETIKPGGVLASGSPD